MNTKNRSNGYQYLTLILVLSLTSPVYAETIEYLLFDLKPRMMIVDGKVGGLVGSRAMEIFEQAELTVNVTSNLPANRVLSLLLADTPNLCSVGWFKTKEREPHYRYSQAIFQDPQHIILTKRANKEIFDRYHSLAELLTDPEQILGKSRGLSYGHDLDELISQSRTPTVDVNSFQEMFMMLAAGRYQYLVSDGLELDSILEQAKVIKADFISYEFDDMPPGEQRYILCSLATSAETIERINQAIASVTFNAK